MINGPNIQVDITEFIHSLSSIQIYRNWIGSIAIRHIQRLPFFIGLIVGILMACE